MGFLPAVANLVTPPLNLQAAAGTVVFGAGEPGDSYNRVQLQSNGSLIFGSGSLPPDASLSRTAPGVLRFNSGNVRLAGSLDVDTAGKGLLIATGANAKAGSGTLAAGTVTIANTSVTVSSMIFLTDISGGSNLGILSVGAVTAGTGFVVNSSNALDASTFNYLIIEPG
jgi:hypothetical protein